MKKLLCENSECVFCVRTDKGKYFLEKKHDWMAAIMNNNR